MDFGVGSFLLRSCLPIDDQLERLSNFDCPTVTLFGAIVPFYSGIASGACDGSMNDVKPKWVV